MFFYVQDCSYNHFTTLCWKCLILYSRTGLSSSRPWSSVCFTHFLPRVMACIYSVLEDRMLTFILSTDLIWLFPIFNSLICTLPHLYICVSPTTTKVQIVQKRNSSVLLFSATVSPFTHLNRYTLISFPSFIPSSSFFFFEIGTHYVSLTAPELPIENRLDLNSKPASVSWRLGLKVYTITPELSFFFLSQSWVIYHRQYGATACRGSLVHL